MFERTSSHRPNHTHLSRRPAHRRRKLTASLVAALVAILPAGIAVVPAQAQDPTGGSAGAEASAADVVEIDFTDDVPGAPPADWSPLWRDSTFVVEDEPLRLVHRAETSGRQGLSPDAVGVVAGDVEVSALMRTTSAVSGGTRKMIMLHAGGEPGAEDAYYVDFRWSGSEGPFFRINRYRDGAFSTLARGPVLSDTPVEAVWYHVVFQRAGDTLRFKTWPYGQDEPAGWMVTATDTAHNEGLVAVGHPTGGAVVTEWAYLASGAPGEVPRAPAGLVPAPEVPDPPSSVAVVPHQRELSVRWDAVEAADWYEVERDGQLVASPWMMTAYADPLAAAGQEVSYRVRGVSAVLGAGPWSTVGTGVAATPPFSDHLTPFEASGGQITSLEDEQDFLAEVADLSDRVAVDQVGESVEGRPMHLVRIGYPSAPEPHEIQQRPTFYAICTVHGNEWTPRESCLRLIRDLALTDDPDTLDVLQNHAVIVTPTANPDGRARGSRENAQGIDVNRDYLALRSPEARVIVDQLRTYEPDVVVDGHNCCDDSVVAMWSQNLNVAAGLRQAGQGLVRDGLLSTADHLGYTNTPSPLSTLGNPQIARNYSGLRHSVSILNEVRGGAIAGRVEEAAGYPQAATNRRIRAVAAFDMVLDSAITYAVDHEDQIAAARVASVAAAEANSDPVYLGGDENRPPRPEEIIEPAVCGYLVAGDEYTSSGAADQFAVHGVIGTETGAGVVLVPAGQRMGRLVPLLLDRRSQWAIAEAVELDDARETVVLRDADTAVPNHAVPGGCTVNDVILDELDWPTKAAYVRHVSDTVNGLRSDGVLTAREAATIRQAALSS
ncbi:M14 family zinc carboxypeptidase [Phytoactinopolyspora limicola]|uniref:M14 family zinc carboxypeptidase n=1 Tax=Phytoactinopolyspora limicola TaxID=2715536 RepID=UPI00140A6BE6|nr:M14 family zinc carboxypeptidase [Phytoactinopolyspora limicola]